jgi:hypothetical protein
MLVMRTTEDPTNPLGEFIGAKQTLGLYNFALAVNPFGFDRVQPRTLLRQQAAHDPYSFTALFDLSVVLPELTPDLPGDVPGSVVPGENHGLLASPASSFSAHHERNRVVLWNSRASHPRI